MKTIKKFAGILVALAILCFVGCNWFSSNYKDNNEGRMILSLKSSLEQVENDSCLESLEYTYNSIVKVPSSADSDKTLYYVMYKGTVVMGIDLAKVNIEENPKNKNKILVTIPLIEIKDPYVDPGSLDYLYTGEVSEEETSGIDAYKLCKEDLKKAAKKDTELIKIAKENVENELRALFNSVYAAEHKKPEVEYQWEE